MANNAPTKADLLKTALSVLELADGKYIVESVNFETARNPTLAGHGISHPTHIRCRIGIKVDEDFNKIYKAYCNKKERHSATLTLKASSNDQNMETFKFAGVIVTNYAYEYLNPRQQVGQNDAALKNHTVNITLDALKVTDSKNNTVHLEH